MRTAIWLVVLLIILCALLFGLLPQTNPAVRAQRDAAAIERSQWITRGVVALIVVVVVVAAGVGSAFVWHAWKEARTHRPKDGLYGQLPASWNMASPANQPNAQVARAFTYNMDRLGGGAAVAKRFLEPPEEPLQLAAPEQALSTEQVIDKDPKNYPHSLVVGETGGGKSNIMRYIMQHLAQRYPADFVICELGGLDWGDMATARTEQGIADAVEAVYGELGARMARLYRAGYSHISQAHERYLFLVFEDMEETLDRLRDIDRQQADNVKMALRSMARIGRKPGVGLLATTQAGTSDVLDAHVKKNFHNIYLTAGSQTTAEMFRVQVNLSALAPGMAYSIVHRQVVTFPQVARPVLPLWNGYRELLGDGVTTGGQLVVEPPQPLLGAPATGGNQWQPVEKLLPGRMPTAEQAAWLRANFRKGQRDRGINAACDALWGYKDDVVAGYVNDALEGKL